MTHFLLVTHIFEGGNVINKNIINRQSDKIYYDINDKYNNISVIERYTGTMKYKTEITLELPRDRVIELFDDPENLKHWQSGLKSFELISGEAGQPGAKSRLVYDMNGRKVEMIETIISRDLPNVLSGTYNATGVHNLVINCFYEEGPNLTRWVTENEFYFSGFMKLMGVFMKGSFPKQTLADMNRFKVFAESK